MARKCFAPLSAALALALLAGDSRAGATVDLLFVSYNGASITPTNWFRSASVRPGDTLVMDIVLRTQSPLAFHSFSLEYDLSPSESAHPLTPGHKGNWLGVALDETNPNLTYAPRAPFSPTTPHFVGSWQSTNGGSTTLFLPPSPGGGYTVGTIVWTLSSFPFDVNYIFSGLFNPGVDGIADNNFNLIDSYVLFHSAAVGPIPEPGTAALLGLGLVGLAAAGRRPLS